MARASDAELAAARTRYEAGGSLGAIAKATGRNRSTISRWAKTHGWARPEGFADTTDAAATAVARKRNRLHWLDIRVDEANEAARLVTASRLRLAELLDKKDDKGARIASVTWAITLDKTIAIAHSITADEANTDPNRTDPAEIERAILGIVDALTPADERE